MKTSESVEKNLQTIFRKYRLSKKLTLEMVKDWIWNDEGESAMDASNRFQKKWFKYLAHISDIDEFNGILQEFVDAWNFFPHKSLGGKSPNEMIQQTLQKNPQDIQRGAKRMPAIIVGGRKMSWDNYWGMIQKMESLQIPFKNWVEKDLLPKYKEFLKENIGIKTVQKHLEVAEIFFERAMHIGFVEFDEMRDDFVQKEFPRWWQTHVLMSNLTEKEVLSSLTKLFRFIAIAYSKDIRRFGFN